MENANHRCCDKGSTEMFQEEYDGLSESVVRYLLIVMLSVTLKRCPKLLVANTTKWLNENESPKSLEALYCNEAGKPGWTRYVSKDPYLNDEIFYNWLGCFSHNSPV